MSVNLSFFTDLHLRGQGPSSRKDDYPTSILNKLEYCLDYSSKNSDIALFGGDFCHSHKLASDSVKEKAIELFDNNLKVPFIYTWGQHDLNGKDYNSRHVSSQAFILRQASRVVQNIEESPADKDLVKEINGIKVGFISCPSGFDPIKWSIRMSKRGKPKGIDVRVALVHHLITNEQEDWYIDPELFCTGDKDNRVIDVVLCGDLHQGFEPFRNSFDTLFLNPGSLGRTQKTKNDLSRPIRGVDISIDEKTKECSWSYWDVESALSGDDVFRKSAPIIEEKVGIDIDDRTEGEKVEFEEVMTVLEEIGAERIDIWDMLEREARKKKLDDPLINYILSKRPDA
jgi:predicted phosphodiesterase